MSDDEDLYDLADDAPAASKPTAPFKVGEGAVAPDRPAVLRPIAYKHPQTLGTGPDEMDFTDRVKDLYLPLALIGGGLIVECIAVYLMLRPGDELSEMMGRMGLGIAIHIILMLAAMGIAAKFRGINLGRIPIAVLKLCAISIGPNAIMILLLPVLGWIPLGGLVIWGIGFCLYFAFLGAMFDLDQSDTWYCVCVIFVVKLAVALGLRSIL